MNFEDLEDFQERLRGGISQYSQRDGICLFKELIPLQLLTVSSSYLGDEDIEVIDEDNQSLGFLCFCKNLSEESLNNLDSITDAQYISYIFEVSRENFNLSLPFRFEYNYFVVHLSRYEKYLERYMPYSTLWGGYAHRDNMETSYGSAYTFKPNFIQACAGIRFPTQYHQEKCFRSTEQPYAFERFLHLYHLLELIYDWEFINKLRSLGDDLTGLGSWLQKYNSKTDLERLNLILKDRYDEDRFNIELISSFLSKIYPDYLNQAEKIFFEFGKSSNPYKKDWQPFRNFVVGGFTESNLSSLINRNFTGIQYDKFIIEIAAYWIYRVRCCIAHNKIGEYVMSHEDEEFVAKFAEPLLRLILIQVFKE
jgi:hypothetical protein